MIKTLQRAALVLCLIFSVFWAVSPSVVEADTAVDEDCYLIDPWDCARLARQYAIARGSFPFDPERAQRLGELAMTHVGDQCATEGGNICGWFLRAIFYLPNGDDVEATQAQLEVQRARVVAIKAKLEQSCERGLVMACYWRQEAARDDRILGMYERLGVPVGRATRFGEFNKWKSITESQMAAVLATLDARCVAGNVTSCAEAAGLRIEYDFKAGKDAIVTSVLTDACLQGNKRACGHAAVAVRNISPRRSEPAELALREQAIAHLVDGCESGLEEVCFAVSEIVPREFEQTWNTKACALNHPKGCEAVAISAFYDEYWVYEASRTSENLARATEALTKACDLKAAYACHLLEHVSGQ